MTTRQREDRRRRIRSDETATRPTKKRVRSKANRLQLYSEGAATTAQPRITDLIPKSKRFMSLWLVLALVPIGLVQLFYWLRVTRLQEIYRHTAPLHLFGPGTIANWVASTLLLLSSLCCLLIYSVRRHKVDDYRGRYQLWLWSALFCGLCSLDAATGLHRLFMVAMIRLTKNSLWANGSAWWLIIGGVMASVLAFKVLGDVWRSRGSAGCFVMSITCYIGATLLYLRTYSLGSPNSDILAWSTLLLGAHALLFYSLLVYSRFVCLEATGAIKRAKKKRKVKKAAAAEEAPAIASPGRYRSLSNERPEGKPKRAKRTKTKKKEAAKLAKPKVAVSDDQQDASEEQPRRRKVRRKERRQQRQAA